MKKRIVSTLMALCMVLTLLPVQVLAAGGAAPQHQLDNTTIGQYTTLGNGVYTLTEDVSISSTLKITGEATLDLNGKTLTMTGDQKAIRVGDGAKLTLRDSGTDGKLTAPGARGVTVAESGTLIMEGGSIVGCQAGDVGGGGVHNSGTFIMKSGTISGCNGSVGGGVYNSYGTFTMEGGSISRCEAADRSGRMGDGDGVYNSGTFTMSGSAEITECRTSGVYNTGTMNANGGSIQTASGSTALYNNGAGTVQTESGSTGTVFKTQVTNEGVISGGTFEDQVTSKRGTISGGNFRSDVSIQSETTVTGGVFEGDVSIQGGTVSGGTFKGKVKSYGTISGGTFTGAVTNYDTITGGTFEGDVTCEGRLLGGGSGGSLVGGTVSGGSFKNPIQVIYGTIIGPEYKWTEKEPSYGGQYRLTYQVDGKAYAWQWLGEGFFPVMPQGPDKEGHTFLTWVYGDGEDKDKMVNEGDPLTTDRTAVARYAVGGGTEQEPCRIGSKEELEFFAVQVDRFGSTGLCAVLTNDIVVNSGTFDEAGRYTPAAGETVSGMNPIGSETQPYTGTFNGGGYTIRGVYRDNREALNSLYSDAVYPAGLFGWLKGATVKNLTVTGYVGGRACVGGIAGHADAGTTILNCRNECIVVSVDRFSGEYGPAQYAGGIVGYNEGKVTACCNTGTVTGADSVGGIAGGPAGTVSDCYNVGAVTGDSHVGGIAGGPAGTVSYCYNVGTVTGGVEIANDATVSKCFFLGTQGMSAEKFANGTVLAALIDGRADGAHPWDTECVGKRLSDGGMRLPVLAWQKLSAAHEGGTATCTEKAVCTLCGQAYGTVDANNHVGGTELRNAKKATCTEDGHTGDTYCKGCGVKLQSGTAIKATGHTGGTATCVSAAVCTVCKQAYGKKDAGNHDLKHTAAKAPGIYARGNTEYWQCKACGKYFADANGTKTISQSDTVIPPRGRTAESGSENGKSSPGTFDAGIGVYGVTAVTSLTGLALLRRKRRDEE